MEFEKIENSIGYTFKNKELLKKALTHTSYAYENNIESNEKLEFLGDSILEFISSKYIYQKYPKLKDPIKSYQEIYLPLYKDKKTRREVSKRSGINIRHAKSKNKGSNNITETSSTFSIKRFLNLVMSGIITPVIKAPKRA